jgi:hypothetical protein
VGVNLILRGQKPVNNRQRHGTANYLLLPLYIFFSFFFFLFFFFSSSSLS